ncbi:MAG TPA: hypothetical protein VJ418_16165 [Streptosporangiaceae bacterium]|jgi:CRP-like cAMP-binding protein|nr:hypothetical protein [Streptosporangiaceae bacterium]
MIVITTPTGQIGRQVLGHVLESGEHFGSSPAIRHSSRPASARTSTSSRAPMATRQLRTRHLPAPMPFSG